MQLATETAFWVSLGAAAWICIGYPVLLRLLAFGFGKASTRDTSFEPFVTIVIPTFNEQSHIESKLQNVLGLGYPRAKLQILVVDGNSDDATVAIVSRFLGRGITLIKQPCRSGKFEAVLEGVKNSRGEIILSTDATSYFAADTLKKCVSYFADPKVGGVAARFLTTLHSGAVLSLGSRWYWGIDSRLKAIESSLHSAAGLIGEFCAFRRNALETWSADVNNTHGIADDTAISFLLVRQGYRIALANDIHVEEEAPQSYADFLKQKTRSLNLSIGVAAKNLGMVGLRYGWYSAFIQPNRRVFFLLLPFFLGTLLATSIVLGYARGGYYLWLFFAQLAAYALGACGFLKSSRNNPAIQAFHFAVWYNIAMVNAWAGFFLQRNFTIWEKIAKPEKEPELDRRRAS